MSALVLLADLRLSVRCHSVYRRDHSHSHQVSQLSTLFRNINLILKHHSGQNKSAIESTELPLLTTYAMDPKHPRKITICPASGINATRVSRLRERIPSIEEVHLSSSRAVKVDSSEALMKGIEYGFGGDEVWKMDGERLREFWEIIKGWNEPE